MCTGEGTTNKMRRGKRRKKFFDYVEAYFQVTPPDKQKGVRELYDEFKKKVYKSKKNSH